MVTQPTPKYRVIADDLRQAILTGNIPLGGQLPARRELEQTYSVTQVTVRAAMQVLEREGLITIRQGTRPRVVDRSPQNTHPGPPPQWDPRLLTTQLAILAQECLRLRRLAATGSPVTPQALEHLPVLLLNAQILADRLWGATPHHPQRARPPLKGQHPVDDEIQCAVCPLCGRRPAAAISAQQAFCGNEQCSVLTWDMTRTLDENLLNTNTIRLPATLTGDEDPAATFTCPDCRQVSHYPKDVEYSYCGNCHAFKADPALRCMEPTCPNFGSYDYGGGTCPRDHALPPAWRRR